MVGKRRPHKSRPIYKKIIGTGEIPRESKIDVNSSAPPLNQLHIDEINEPQVDRFGHLPPEIIDLICAKSPTCWSLLTLNKLWFSVALPHVYRYPKLTPVNFPLFVNAISQDRQYGQMVRKLDLVNIAQVGKNSMISRLLHRCSLNLEVFIAPQSHFGYAPMVSLSHCENLKILDLSLISEKVDLHGLFNSIQKFKNLETLYFPRSSLKCNTEIQMNWPPRLKCLGLSGGFPAEFIENTDFPKTLSELQISNCPYLTSESMYILLSKIGHQLKRLACIYPLVLLNENSLDMVFLLCPNLVKLQVSVEYISSDAFDEPLIPPNHPLTSLILASSGLMGHAEKIRASDILLATDYFPKLKLVFISLLLGWNPQSSSLMGLVSTLEERGGGLWMS